MAKAAAGMLPTRAETAEMKRVAEQLESENPRWIVIFGEYSREFVAFPRFPVPSGTVVAARYPAAVPGRMRAIEARHAMPAPDPVRPGQPPAATPRGDHRARHPDREESP